MGGEHLSNPADKVERWSIDRLVPYARNARTHSDEQVAQIAASIKEWGWTTPVLADPTGQIIAGHGRVMAARKLGLTEVPVMVADGWTDAQKRAYVLADNKLALNAGWDEELLALELSELQDLGADLGLIGFEDDELAKLMKAGGTEGLTDPDEAPEVAQFAVTQPGEIWLMGPHRLLCGDATMLNDADKLMDGYKADLIVTDPPYNVAYEGGTKDKLKIKNDDMDDESFYQFLLAAYTNYFAVAKDGCGIYVFHADSEGTNFRKAMKDSGFKLAQCCIWVKQSLVLGRQDYQWQHEPVLYGWREGGKHKWYSDRKQTTVWRFDKPTRNDVHPTMKPVDLISYPIENSSRGGDIVVDFFGGSGSTLIACERTGRVSRTMELDPKYCDVIVKRWQDFTGQKATLAGDGRTFDEVADGRTQAQAHAA